MGYSCTARAGLALDTIISALKGGEPEGEPSNTYYRRGRKHFFETGRERPDGAITGAIFRELPDNRCRRAGSFRVEPDGTITRFPGTSAPERQAAELIAADEYNRRYGAFTTL